MAINTVLRRSCALAFLSFVLTPNVAGSIVASSNVAILDDFKVLATEHQSVTDTLLYRRKDTPPFQNNTLLFPGNDTGTGGDFHRYHESGHGFTSRLNITDPFDAWENHQLAEPFPFWTKNMRSVMESNTSEWFMKFLDNYANEDSFHCRQRGLSQ